MSRKLLIIGFVWPEPTSSAAGVRMLQLIQLFNNLRYNIFFVSSAKLSERSIDFDAFGVKTKSIALNDSSFDNFISELSPDVVLFDRFMTEEQFGWRVAEQCPDTIRLLDTEDFHGLRKGRELALKSGAPFRLSYLQNDVTKRELASMYRCDLSLIISESEIEILTDSLGFTKELLHYLPFLLSGNDIEKEPDLPDFNSRQHFITIGNFKHPPNLDAMVYLKQKIWPLIRASLPKTELHVYGAYATKQAYQLHNESDGFLVKGFAKNVDMVMKQARVCLAPLRFGAGLKGKLVDAMKNGTPSIMSSIASEGMFGDLMPSGLIEDNAEDFAESAIRLYTDNALWQEKSTQGFNALDQRFKKDNHITYFTNRLQDLEKDLLQLRQNNFIGQLLQHHSLQSTKYMSKWIEEKNK